MSFASSSARIGSLVDPEMINKDRINIDSLYGVIASMGASDARRFELDVRRYRKDGQASEFLLGVLAIAAGRSRGRSHQVRVFDLQPNVIGIAFRSRETRAEAH